MHPASSTYHQNLFFEGKQHVNTVFARKRGLDYYPFGSLMPGRTYVAPTGAGYRFGFNGHESNYEISGVGNHVSWGDYGMDTRLATRWNIDPQWQKLPGQSPYSVNNNCPVTYTDPNGEFGVPGAVVGFAIGGVSSITKSVIENGWSSLKDKKTWLKAGVNATGGLIVGATGGLASGLVATAATTFSSSLAEDAIDGQDLDFQKAGISSFIATATFGIAKYSSDKIAMAATRHWWSRGNTNSLMRWIGKSPKTNVAQVVDRLADIGGLGTSLGIDKLFKRPKTITKNLPEVNVIGERTGDEVKINQQETLQKIEKIRDESQ